MKFSNWNNFAPWFLSLTCTITLIIIGAFLVGNIEWYKSTVFDSTIPDVNTPQYRFYAYHLHLSMIKRSVGLFSGFAIMFLGMGVAFYTLKEPITFDGQAKSVTLKLITASPGIVALIVGAYLISSTIISKDHFSSYGEGQTVNQLPLDTTDRPKLP